MLPGDIVNLSLTYNAERHQYDLAIATSSSVTIRQSLNALESDEPFSDVVIGMENQPSTCSSLPQSTGLAFSNIAIQWADDNTTKSCSGQLGPSTNPPCAIQATCANSVVDFQWEAKREYDHRRVEL